MNVAETRQALANGFNSIEIGEITAFTAKGSKLGNSNLSSGKVKDSNEDKNYPNVIIHCKMFEIFDGEVFFCLTRRSVLPSPWSFENKMAAESAEF